MSDYSEDAPVVSLHDTRRVKSARKQHRCDVCRSPILPGQSYDRSIGVVDGEFQTMRVHARPMCSFDEAEKAEPERQFREDQARFFPSPEAHP